MHRLFISLILSFVTLFNLVIFAPNSALAAVDSHCDKSSSFLFLPTWYKYLDIGGPNCDIQGPLKPDGTGLDWEKASGRVALAVIEAMLRIATLISVGFVILGGIRYITSQGEPENSKSARQTIVNALIGLVISLLAAAIVAFVANRLTI